MELESCLRSRYLASQQASEHRLPCKSKSQPQLENGASSELQFCPPAGLLIPVSLSILAAVELLALLFASCSAAHFTLRSRVVSPAFSVISIHPVSYSSRTRFASALFLDSLLRRTSPNFSIRRLGRVHPVPQPFTPTTCLLFELLICLLVQTLLLLQGLPRYFLFRCFATIVQGVAYPLRSAGDLFRFPHVSVWASAGHLECFMERVLSGHRELVLVSREF